jgi:predicted secreted hydrolase
LSPRPLRARLSLPEGRRRLPLEFPRDHGAHPEFRQEWWYVTGWLSTARGDPLGFQVTFFRARPDIDTPNPSALTPRQVILAHAAISDPRQGRLRHDERAARAALGLAGAEQGTRELGSTVGIWRFKARRIARASQHADSRSTLNSTPSSRRCCRASKDSRAKAKAR